MSKQFVFSSSSNENTIEMLVDDLNDSCSSIFKKHDLVSTYSKGETDYECCLEQSNKLSKFYDLVANANNIVGLISLITMSPCIATEIKVMNESSNSNGDKYMESYPILMSRHISEYELRTTSKDNWNPFLNICAKDISDDFQIALYTWEELLNNTLDLTLNVLREHIRNNYNPAQHAVVSISALEQWYSNYEKGDCNEKKYDHMLDRYATPEMKSKLKDFIPLKTIDGESLGKQISKIRGLILHPNGARKLKFVEGKQLDEVALRNITEVIIIILLRAVFKKCGFSESVVNRYGSASYTVLREHFIIEL